MANATTFRCDVDGKVAYADRPCPDGQPGRIVAPASFPSTSDSAAARERARSDQRALAAIDRERVAQQRGEREDVRRAARGAAQRGRQARACLLLASKAKRARDDYDLATTRDLTRRRAALRRADDDYAALCGSRAG